MCLINVYATQRFEGRMSSSDDENNDLPTSPDYERVSSPLGEIQSSPVRDLLSSPILVYESASDGDTSSASTDYEPLTKKEVSRSAMYWPGQCNDCADETTNTSYLVNPSFLEAVHWPEQQDPVPHEHARGCADEVANTSNYEDGGNGTLLSEQSTSSSVSEDESSLESDSSEDRVEDGDGSGNDTEDDSSVSSDGGESFASEESDRSSGSDVTRVFAVYDGSSMSVDEGVFHVMKLFVEESLSKKTTGKVLKALQRFLPDDNNMPKTEHALFQYVKSLSPLPEEKVHYYCKRCQFYLGRNHKKCTLCNSEFSNKFYQLSLEDQLRNLFEVHNLADYIDQYAAGRAQSDPDVYVDVCDGSEYQRVKIPGQYNLTLLGHTDGVSVSKSSDVSLWPIEYSILELPQCLRFHFLLVNGVWLDGQKPVLNTYFTPFAEELEVSHTAGVTWKHPKTGQNETSYVSCPGFCADAPVRAQLQNILSHGGKHSCHMCEQKMKRMPQQPVIPGVKKKPRKRVYDFQEAPSRLRTAERMEMQGEITLQRKIQANGGKFQPEKGVLGRSIICKVPQCDRSSAVYPEYMHLLLGIVKQFMLLWFHSDKKEHYSLREHRDAINYFLLNIKVPDFVTRIPRSTESYCKWKANELRSFLLYYSLVVLHPFMKHEYFQHWLLFVVSLEILLRDKIYEQDISKAEIMLKVFVRNFSGLYRKEDMTYNLHMLLHLPLTVRRWGNLQFNSAFQFENFNGSLAKCIHGTKNQGKELINTVQLICGVNILAARIQSCEREKAARKIELRSKIKDYEVSDEERQLLDNVSLSSHHSFFYRAAIGREVFTSVLYERQVKRNNFTVCFEENSQKMYGKIKCFVNCNSDNNLVFVTPFSIDHMSRHFMKKVK